MQSKADLQKIQSLKQVKKAAGFFGQYHEIIYPAESFKMAVRTKSQLSIKFIAVVLYKYDLKYMADPKTAGRMKYGLREAIASHIQANPSLVSQWVNTARAHMKIYIDFKTDVNNILELF